MAIFNPNVAQGKDEMPDWTKVSRPISEVTADKSTGIALAGVGQGIEGLTGIIDTTAKDIINKDVRRTVEPIREDYTNQLLATKAIVQGADSYVPPAGSGMDLTADAHSIGGQSTGGIPAGIDAGLRKVDQIQNMLKYGNGKLGVDETYYDMRLKTAVVNLRDKYPGFVDYIDQRVSAITGMNPANEMVNDLTRQIAQLQTSKKTEFDKELDIARKAMADGMQGAGQQFETLLQRGPEYLPTWRQWFATESRKWREIQERDILRKDKREGDTDFRKTREEDWNNYVSTVVSNAMGTTISITGMEKPMTTVQLMEDFQNNPNKYNPMAISEFAAKLRAQAISIGAQLDAKAGETQKDNSGKTYSYNSDIGAAKVREIKDTIMAYYKNADDALMSGGPQGAGMAFYWARRAAAMGENTKYEVYSGPEGETLRLWNVIKTDMGDQAVPNLMTGVIKEGVDKSVNKLFEKSMLRAKTQANPQDGKPAQTPFTLKGMNDEALSLEQRGQIDKAVRARYINGGINLMLKDITDPETPVNAKINSLRFFFSPEGQGLMSQFNNDKINPITGKQEPGRQTLWGRFTSSDVVSAVKKLSDQDPRIGEMYSNWIRKEAGAGMFYKDIMNLNTITGRDDLYIKYNDGKGTNGGVPHIELLSDKGALESPVGQKARMNQYGIPQYGPDMGVDVGRRQPYEGQIKMAQQTISRVNEALRGLDRVTKGLGGDSSAELLSFLMQAQVEMGQRWEGLPAKLIDAIAAAQGKGKLKDLYDQQNKEKK